MTKGFTDTLVDDLIEIVRKFEKGRATLGQVDALAESIKGALRVPSPHSEDFLTPRDEFAMAALPEMLKGESVSVETAAKICGVTVQAYTWREHFPKVAAILAYEQADACMAARQATGASTPEGAA